MYSMTLRSNTELPALQEIWKKNRETSETEDDAQKRLNSSMSFLFCSVVLWTVVACWINHVAKKLSTFSANNISVFSSHKAIIFTFMHLPDTFIQSNPRYNFFSSCIPWESKPWLWVASAKLYCWTTEMLKHTASEDLEYSAIV